ncbi:hypothetical protein AMECASPLE_033088 [Ameca splendens]|uniref:Secreted protein n=1 Tax=Ameca splendens TaxID=208324 RepID=A0ABV1AFS5_9TELE
MFAFCLCFYFLFICFSSFHTDYFNVTMSHSNVNSGTAHYTDAWRQGFSRYSSSYQWVSGNTTGSVLRRARNWKSGAALPKKSQWKRDNRPCGCLSKNPFTVMPV